MLVIFPFEEPFYRERGVEAEFVGHPLADLPLPTISREEFAAANGLDPDQPPGSACSPAAAPRRFAAILAGICFGSRPRRDSAISTLPEARSSSPAAVRIPYPACPHAECRTARAKSVDLVEITRRRARPSALVEDARAALYHARASIVASGTATVEAALIGNPFVVVYRVSPLTYAIAKRVVTVPHVAMANLIAGKRVVPELIQDDFTASNIVQHLEPLLPDGPARESMMTGAQGHPEPACRSPAAGRTEKNRRH